MFQRKVAGTENGAGLKVERIDIYGEPGALWAVVHLSFSMPSSLEDASDVVDIRVKVPGIDAGMSLDQIGDRAMEQAESVVWMVAGIHNLDTAQTQWWPGKGCYLSAAA